MSTFLISENECLPFEEVPIIKKLLFFKNSIVLFRLTTLQIGILNTAPVETFITFSFISADLSFGIIIPSKLKNSAVLIMFPKLFISVIESRIRRNLGSFAIKELKSSY